MDYETRTWRGLRFAYTVRARRRATFSRDDERWSLFPERSDCWATTPRRAVQLAARIPRVVLREEGLIVERLAAHQVMDYATSGHKWRWRMSCTDVACFETGAMLYDSMPSPREYEAELRTPSWHEDDGVRNHKGIHARRMPHSWRHAGARACRTTA